LSERVGAALGSLAWRLGWRREVVESQLARAFPDSDATWVQATARACFRHVGREWLTVPYVTRHGLEEVRRRVVVFDGREVLREAFDEGRGVVVVSAHFGNWELAGSALVAFGYPVAAVMQALKNPSLNDFVKETRNRLGMGLIDRAGAWDLLTGSIAARRVVAFVADQDARRSGVFVPFFGRPASTHRAPALLALRTGAPFLVGGVHRTGHAQYHTWVARIDPPEGLDTREQVLEMTRAWTAELERRVRLYPEQYFWHHKRWKSVPPGTGPAVAGITIQEESE
jgi:KDO2-lipid IV(A) lauroyltransferase